MSATLQDPKWTNVAVLKGNVVDEVSKLKQEIAGDIVIYASYRLFGQTSDKKRMRLAGTKTIGDGLALLTYRPVRDA